MAGILLESTEFIPPTLILPKFGDFIEAPSIAELVVPQKPPLMQFNSENMDVAFHILWTAQSEGREALDKGRELAVGIPVTIGVVEDYFFSDKWKQQNTGTEYY